MKFNTKLLHGKAGRNTPDGATLPGISQVSAFSYDSAEHLEKVFGNKSPGFAYTRIGNPTVEHLNRESMKWKEVQALLPVLPEWQPSP